MGRQPRKLPLLPSATAPLSRATPCAWQVTYRMVLGSTLIVGGTVLAILVGPSGVAKFTAEDLICFWGATPWIIYLV